MNKEFSGLDRLLVGLDRGLKALLAAPPAARPVPTAASPEKTAPSEAQLSPADRRQSAALMRVNHAGEIAAQGLYHGQALVARDPACRALLDRAAREEADHLAWCKQRLAELGDRPSLLTPAWYAGSFAIGAIAGFASDRANLGFVAETERQVEAHLNDHLHRLPTGDTRSRAILEAMRNDEIEHGAAARNAGAAEPPAAIKRAMRLVSKVMTVTAARI